MKERVEVKPDLKELAAQILKERTPSPEQVIYQPTVEFLDPEGQLTREERGKVVAMGDRTAKAYRYLKDEVIEDRVKKDKTANFYLMYALAARDSKEIAHTSILEQVNVGPQELGGDPPIVVEGVSVLSALRDICSLRHFGFEAFSSRGGIFPENYWRVPSVLQDSNIAEDLAAINQEIYDIYLYLTQKGIEHYLQVLPKKEEEKEWQWQWRVLSHSLDDSRQVTNQSFLNHFSMHPNSALSLREALVKLSSSELPETVEIADKLRQVAKAGLPTLMRYTDASDYTSSLPEKRESIRKAAGIRKWSYNSGRPGKSRFLGYSITPDAERTFLAAVIAKGGDFSFEEVFEKLRNLSTDQIYSLIEETFNGIGLHDKPPKELELIQITAHFEMSVGAIYEAIRHRLATHIVGRFTPYRGYTIPDVYYELGLDKDYITAIRLNEQAYDLIRNLGGKFEEVFGPYFVARAHLVPATIRISALDVSHLLKIRADEGAHPDLREPMLEFEKTLRDNNSSIFGHLVKKS